jgi:hypothetical protein
MSISAISSNINSLQANQTNSLAQIKQDLDKLNSTLKSGDLSAAKEAFAQLQKDTPSGKNPLSSDMKSLGEALDSGDLTAAQEAYDNIQSMVSQGPPAEESGSTKGSPAGGSGNTNKSSDSTGTSQSSSQTYDKRDTNKDGIVSSQEIIEYALTHSSESDNSQQIPASSDDNDNSVGRYLNTTA